MTKSVRKNPAAAAAVYAGEGCTLIVSPVLRLVGRSFRRGLQTGVLILLFLSQIRRPPAPPLQYPILLKPSHTSFLDTFQLLSADSRQLGEPPKQKGVTGYEPKNYIPTNQSKKVFEPLSRGSTKNRQTSIAGNMSDMGAREDESDRREDATAATSELDVVFHDDDIVVLNKPHGLRTVPGKASGPEAETRAHVRYV